MILLEDNLLLASGRSLNFTWTGQGFVCKLLSFFGEDIEEGHGNSRSLALSSLIDKAGVTLFRQTHKRHSLYRANILKELFWYYYNSKSMPPVERDTSLEILYSLIDYLHAFQSSGNPI